MKKKNNKSITQSQSLYTFSGTELLSRWFINIYFLSSLICSFGLRSLVGRKHPTTNPPSVPAAKYRFSRKCWPKFAPVPKLDQLNVLLLGNLQGPPITQLSPQRVSMLQRADESCLFKDWVSVEGIEQEENGANANHRAKDQRVPSLSQVDSLNEVVDSWETVWKSVN